jgi:NAD(P)-dependent dehydrogenase (short-subunit alcohol dehydrogenase family)
MEGMMANPEEYGNDNIKVMLAATPGGSRLAEPQEIAYAAGMLCEDEAGWINGNHVHVNGGLYLG